MRWPAGWDSTQVEVMPRGDLASTLRGTCQVRSVRSAVMSEPEPWSPPEQMPRWVWKAVAVFWLGFIATVVDSLDLDKLSALSLLLLVSLFLSLAVEPGVNRLSRRGLAARHGDGAHPRRACCWRSSSSSWPSARSSASRSPTCCGTPRSTSTAP